MKILLSSHFYAPSIGGVESVSRLLAQEFVAQGHEVRIVTTTPGFAPSEFPVIRRPGCRELLSVTRWADVVFHNNISLRQAWPLRVIRKPWVIAHHTWIRNTSGQIGLAEWIKLRLLSRATNISISPAIAAALPSPSRVIPDPYDPDTFHIDTNIPRNRDLIFVGRLVSDKGAEILLGALELLKAQGFTPNLTIVGDGPERTALAARAELFLRGQVIFTGAKTGTELKTLINQHRVTVVPSRWNEPFGLVALEAIACGCFVVGTRGGGLRQAIGPCGMTVPNGDSSALAAALRAALEQSREAGQRPSVAEQHLKLHQPSTIAAKYLAVFREALA